MFTIGQVYKRTELHKQFRGQKQGGISTPKNHPLIFLFSGESGHKYGYRDGFREDGIFWYTGEGQVGDMQMIRGNLAIRDHERNGRALHLFEQVSRSHVRYLGEATYTGHHHEAAPDKPGNPRRAIIFELALSGNGGPLGNLDVRLPPRRVDGRLWRLPIGKLRELALLEPSEKSTPHQRKVNVYTRTQAVRIYVLRRANGKCEGCMNAAPFITPSGKQYLEPHHIRRLSDGGPDHPRWVAALCPNCHCRVHYSRDGREYNREIADRLGELEKNQ